jgi:CDP-glucose 4,6-dehydratase
MVGSWLTRTLVEAGTYVVALIPDFDPQSELIRSGVVNSVNVVSGRLEDYEAVERSINGHEVDTVFHLGAQTIVGTADRSPRATFRSNIEGTWNVLDACRLMNGMVERVVVASSDKAYGEQVLPYVETMPLEGRHPYEVSKSCTDLLTTSYAITYGLRAAIARCGNIYGGGDLNWSRIIPGTFRSIIEGQRPVLRSDGTFVRDYLHVQDVVSAYIALADNVHRDDVAGNGFNFSDESPLTVMEIYTACCVAAGVPGLEPKILNKAQGEIKDQYLNASLARESLGWSAKIQLAEGLAETYAWYRDLLEHRNG